MSAKATGTAGEVPGSTPITVRVQVPTPSRSLARARRASASGLAASDLPTRVTAAPEAPGGGSAEVDGEAVTGIVAGALAIVDTTTVPSTPTAKDDVPTATSVAVTMDGGRLAGSEPSVTVRRYSNCAAPGMFAVSRAVDPR
jgi:hypothetical protein